MMKYIRSCLCIILAIALMSGCKISMDTQIDNIITFVNEDEQFRSIYDKALTVSPVESIEYYTYVLSSKMNVDNIWTQAFTVADTLGNETDCQNLVSEVPGSGETDQMIVISAPVDNPASCVCALETFYVFKEAKIRKNNTIRLLLYDSAEGLNNYSSISKDKYEAILADVELNDMAKEYSQFVIDERREIFNRINEIFSQYFLKLTTPDFVLDLPDEDYPLSPRYLFDTNHNGAESFDNLKKNTQIAATMICLLN